jgi:ADP-ribosyl-[dinitrogen reductase] hydrolase
VLILIPQTEPNFWNKDPLDPKIAAIAAGSFKEREPPEIRGTGYVVESLEAALWAFDRSNSFREGALLAVNLGDDADTTGAVYGQIAGAFYGIDQIPAEWRAKLTRCDRIAELADKLYRFAN